MAYAIGRRVGPAVVRNRVRRRLRHAAQDLARSDRLPAGAYLVSVGPEAAGMSQAELADRLVEAVGRCARRVV